DIYYPILEIIRNHSDGLLRYIKNGAIKIVDGNRGETILTVPVNEFTENTKILFNKIRDGEGAFAIPDIEEFMGKVNLTALKASSADKTDITLVVHDLKTGFKPTLGFSIKSRLGNPSTLLNPSRATNFIYKVENIDDNLFNQVNAINTRLKIRNRIEEIESKGGQIKYHSIENEVFKLNLQVIDSNLPIILANIVLNYYKGLGSDLATLLENLEQDNPCHYKMDYHHSFYSYKIKTFLTDIALGMTPTHVWSGKYDATGGYIIVKEDGELLCYHIYNMNEFQDYLLKNTRLDTPSSSRYGFGKLYKENNEYFIKLNLQIRFKA
ncbi:MAG: HpaII family restriction endonuclease, partial [Syntrophomonadaceae bacterium]|nr:HpaII family restriction endonuclease [Syntrophomonadaceae bacterium]